MQSGFLLEVDPNHNHKSLFSKMGSNAFGRVELGLPRATESKTDWRHPQADLSRKNNNITSTNDGGVVITLRDKLILRQERSENKLTGEYKPEIKSGRLLKLFIWKNTVRYKVYENMRIDGKPHREEIVIYNCELQDSLSNEGMKMFRKAAGLK